VRKLRVAVWVLFAFQRLARGLQAETELGLQQASDGVLARPVAAFCQLVRERAHALGRPQQRLLGITASVALHELAQIIKQLRIAVLDALAPRARLAHPLAPQRLGIVELAETLADRVLRQSARTCRRSDPATPERPGLRRGKPPPLTLVELRRHQPVALGDCSLRIVHGLLFNATTPSPAPYFPTLP